MKAVTPSPLKWELVGPGTPHFEERLAELRQFRGRVLYADGRRPSFQKKDGTFDDADDGMDRVSRHVTVRSENSGLVACTRINPICPAVKSSIESIFGDKELDLVLAEVNVSREDALEAGRWLVIPEYRRSGLGTKLLMAYWAVGRWIGAKIIFGTAGVRDGQTRMIGRHGGELVNSVPPKTSAEYNDEIQITYFNLANPPPELRSPIRAASALLKID